MRTENRMFAGWAIVFACGMLLAMSLGVLNNVATIFIKPVCEALQLTRGAFTFHRTIIAFVGMVTMPYYGRLISKVGTRRIFLLGSIGLGFVTMGYSCASRLWHFYLLAVINGLLFNSVGFMSIGIFLNSWFDEKKGLAMGIAYAGSGLGGAVMIPIIDRVINDIGWQRAYRFMGMTTWIIMIPLILLLIRDKPAGSGRKSDSKQDGTKSSECETGKDGMTLKDALKTKLFWILVIAFFLIGFFSATVCTHSAPYLSDLGYSNTFVSAVISLFMIVMTIGKILLGILYDHFGVVAGNLVVFGGCLGAPAFALLCNISGMPWAYAIFAGITGSALSLPVSILVDRYFGKKEFVSIFGLCSMAATLGTAVAIPVVGTVYDISGSYRPAWNVLLVLSLIMVACLFAAEGISKTKNNKVNQLKIRRRL